MAAALAFVPAACGQETETPQEPETEEIKTVEPDHKLRVIIITGVTELEDDELQPLLDRYSLRLLGAFPTDTRLAVVTNEEITLDDLEIILEGLRTEDVVLTAVPDLVEIPYGESAGPQ